MSPQTSIIHHEKASRQKKNRKKEVKIKRSRYLMIAVRCQHEIEKFSRQRGRNRQMTQLRNS